MFILGISSMLWLYFGTFSLFGITFHSHPLFISALLIILGYQLIFFSIFAKTYAITHLGEEVKSISRLYKYLTIEKASIFGILIILSGLIIYLYILIEWISKGFGDLNEIKNSIVALTLLTIGIETIFNSFMLSI